MAEAVGDAAGRALARRRRHLSVRRVGEREVAARLVVGVRRAEPDAIVGAHDEPDGEAEAVIEAVQADLLLGLRVLVAARGAAAQRARLRHRRRAAGGRRVARVAVVDPALVDDEGGADGDVALDLPGAGQRLLERGEGLVCSWKRKGPVAGYDEKSVKGV